MGDQSELVEKGLPCPDCGSSDNMAQYTDHTYCFGCKATNRTDGSSPSTPRPKKPYDAELAELLNGAIFRNLPDWKIQQSTCEAAGYYTKRVSDEKGFHIALYKNEHGEPVFAKVRIVTAEDSKAGFFKVGDESQVSVQGIETLRGGKMVVVCEGEKDRLSALQLWANKWPVVSIPFGAESSGKAFAKALERLSKYEKVVIALDMDKQGRAGADELARMLPPGKAFIAEFPDHDLTDTVLAKGSDVAIKCLHNAKPFAPDGIIDADDISLEEPEWGASLPYPEMYDWTYGFLPGHLWVGGAGIGMGKSDQAAELVAHHIHPEGNYRRAAMFNYESSPDASLRLILTKLWRKNFSIRNPRDGSENVYWKQEDLEAASAFRKEKCGKLFFNDHKGIVSWPAIKDRIRYLTHSAGIDLAVVDPVAALVAAEKDKNVALDLIFAEAKGLAEELGITILFMSHMARPSEGASHEEGGRCTLAQFRGSNSIAMWADVAWGTERDNQAEDETERATTTLRMLKIRLAGQNTGKTLRRIYSVTSGRLEEIVNKFTQSEDQDSEDIAPPPAREEPTECASGSTSTEGKKRKPRSSPTGSSTAGSPSKA